MDLNLLGTLLLLVGLELVLGVDNILVISILVSRLPPALQNKARLIGLCGALVFRLLFVAGAYWLVTLSRPVLAGYSIKDLILLAGGIFLLYKAVREIHHVVEHPEGSAVAASAVKSATHAVGPVVGQIVLLDAVFSIDSVITAVGMTQNLWVIAIAVLASFAVILAYAKPVGDFILKHPALKILALSFLITIGVTICMEGLQHHVPKAYIYLPMGFALVVELLQMRYSANRRKAGTESGMENT